MMDQQEMEDEDADLIEREEPQSMMNDDVEDNAQGLLAAAGLEDSDADDEPVIYCFIGIMTSKNYVVHTLSFVVSVCCIIKWVSS